MFITNFKLIDVVSKFIKEEHFESICCVIKLYLNIQLHCADTKA